MSAAGYISCWNFSKTESCCDQDFEARLKFQLCLLLKFTSSAKNGVCECDYIKIKEYKCWLYKILYIYLYN